MGRHHWTDVVVVFVFKKFTFTFSFDVNLFLSLFVVLSWMTPACLLVKNIVHEKEMRLKEMMKIMGLGDVIHWLVWAFQTLVMNTVVIIFISILLKVRYKRDVYINKYCILNTIIMFTVW